MTLERALPALRTTSLPKWPWRVVPLGILAFLFLSPGIGIGPGQDQSIFMVIGRGILAGETPYLDLWDHKPPGIYLVAALADLLPGDYWGMLWGFSVAAVVAGAYVVRLLTNRQTALIAAVLLASYPATQGAGMTETFATAAAAGTVWFATRQRWVWSGIFGSLALLTSLQLAPLVVVLGILGWRRGLLPGLIGAAIGAAPVLAWLGVAGALPAAWDAVVVYSAVYTGLDPAFDVPRYLPFVALMVAPLLPLALRRPTSRLEAAMAAWVVLGAAVIVLNGRLFPHYVTPLLFPLAILAGPSVRRLRWREYLYLGVVLTTAVWGWFLAPYPY